MRLVHSKPHCLTDRGLLNLFAMSPREQARRIVDYEARRDAQGHLKVYQLPSGDGGGEREVAGINDPVSP